MSSAGMGTERNVKSTGVLVATARDMWNTRGVQAFYKGLTPALVGVFPYAAIDMSVYETLKLTYVRWNKLNQQSKGKEAAGAFVSLSCGMTSGSVGAIIVYPLSLVRTR
jgi:solute carrier family 25 phosphate transporter 23/24/25/41